MENQNTPPQVNLTQTQPVQTPPPAGAGQPVSPGSTTPKKKLSLTVIIEAILFILLAGGAAAGFVYREQVVSIFAKPSPTPAPQTISPSPTPDPTANWKTYSGEGFSFKYSPEWNYKTESYGVVFSTKVREPQPNYPHETLPENTQIIFRAEDISSNMSLKQWPEYESNKRNLENTNTEIIIGKNGKPDTVETIFPSMLGEKITAFIKDSKVYTISIESYDDIDKAKQEELKNQILSTFKFTDSQTLDTSTWKTYTSDEFKFTLKYPPTYNSGPISELPYVKPGTSEKTNIMSYIAQWTEGEQRVSGAFEGDFITLRIYPENVEPHYQFSSDSKGEDIIVGGQKTLKRLGLGGKIVNIGPINRNGYNFVFQYDIPDAGDKGKFDALLSTFKFTN